MIDPPLRPEQRRLMSPPSTHPQNVSMDQRLGDTSGSMISAFALCWPDEPDFLLYRRENHAIEDQKWFSKNYRTNSKGMARGEPFVVKLTESAAAQQVGGE